MRRSDLISKNWLSYMTSVSVCLISGLIFFASINQSAAQRQSDEITQNAPNETFQIRPGVVLDRASSSVFIMHSEAGIESVDLETGTTHWTTSAAGKPLLVSGNILLAQIATETARLDLATLDITDEGSVIDRISIELPQGVVASIEDGPGRSFEVQAVVVEGEVYIRWTERRQEVAAVERLQKDMAIQSGFGRVDLNESTYYADDSEEIDRRIFESPPPDLTGDERIEGVEATQFRSSDQPHAMTSESVADNSVWEKYEWSIWQRDTGELAGRIRDFQRYSPFAVVSSILIQEVAPHARRQDGEIAAVPLSLRGDRSQHGQGDLEASDSRNGICWPSAALTSGVGRSGPGEGYRTCER